MTREMKQTKTRRENWRSAARSAAPHEKSAAHRVKSSMSAAPCQTSAARRGRLGFRTAALYKAFKALRYLESRTNTTPDGQKP